VRTVFVLVIVFGCAAILAAQTSETIGVVTEITVGRGRVELKPASAADWRPVMPLATVRTGDTIRATADAVVVILLAGGRGIRRIDAGGSPAVLEDATAESTVQKGRALVEQSLRFLSLTSKDPPKGLLATRGPAPLPVVLGPRQAVLSAALLTFEWVGSPGRRYTVRLTGPTGIVLKREVAGNRLPYPDGVPALQRGVEYTVEVGTHGQPTQRASFYVISPEQARDVARDVAELEAVFGPNGGSSAAVAHAGYLASQGLFHDARDVVLRALRADPDQAALYLLLGNIYDRTGLRAQAAEAYAEAEYLTTEKAR